MLLVLLAVEALTTLSLHDYLSVHIFLGLLLIPPVALKLASTGWRFVSYYRGSEPYLRRGPPRLGLRLLVRGLWLIGLLVGATFPGCAMLATRHGAAGLAGAAGRSGLLGGRLDYLRNCLGT